MINLEKIDYVMSVTGCTYEVVRHALLESDGDVDLAIKYIYSTGEEKNGFFKSEEEKDEKSAWKTIPEQVDNFANEVMDAVKEIWNKGNASKLVIESEGKVVLSLSLAISAIGVVIAPLAAILGLSAAALSKYDFKIILDNGEIIDIKEYIKGKKK